jgi:hypothetical protein
MLPLRMMVLAFFNLLFIKQIIILFNRKVGFIIFLLIIRKSRLIDDSENLYFLIKLDKKNNVFELNLLFSHIR